MRGRQALALLLGPSIVVATLDIYEGRDDGHMSAADVSGFCASYPVLTSEDSDDGARLTAARQLLASAPENLQDDIGFVYNFLLQTGPHNGSHEDAQRARRHIERTFADRCQRGLSSRSGITRPTRAARSR